MACSIVVLAKRGKEKKGGIKWKKGIKKLI